MKAILEFNLDTESEYQNFRRVQNVNSSYKALYDICQLIYKGRNIKLKGAVADILYERGIDFEMDWINLEIHEERGKE